MPFTGFQRVLALSRAPGGARREEVGQVPHVVVVGVGLNRRVRLHGVRWSEVQSEARRAGNRRSVLPGAVFCLSSGFIRLPGGLCASGHYL